MMIDRAVDSAIASLLRTIPGLQVLVGAEDIEPELETPFCVVYSDITGFAGRTPVYELTARIEYNSIAGQDAIHDIEIMMSQIDALISPGGDYSTNPEVSAAGLSYLAWQSIARSSQEFGDRRKNVRELLVKAQPN